MARGGGVTFLRSAWWVSCRSPSEHPGLSSWSTSPCTRADVGSCRSLPWPAPSASMETRRQAYSRKGLSHAAGRRRASRSRKADGSNQPHLINICVSNKNMNSTRTTKTTNHPYSPKSATKNIPKWFHLSQSSILTWGWDKMQPVYTILTFTGGDLLSCKKCVKHSAFLK